MPRYLTGIQSSGRPHLGNLLGAIQPALQLSGSVKQSAFYFIADLHTLTSSRDAVLNRENTLHVAAAWLACGLDIEKDVFYRQSDVPEVCELAWYLNCFTPYPMLAQSHSFKDKSANLAMVSAGLFTYPVLMAADILLYDAERVPVGKDQVQHLEIARDIATAFNNFYQQEVFVVPEAYVAEEVMTIPGTDGRKMSKSYGNTINVFADEKALRKTVMGIVTDSTPLEAPKNPDTDTVYALYKTLATEAELGTLRAHYLAGGFGYGQAKQLLYEKLMAVFAEPRRLYTEMMNNPDAIETALLTGAAKAKDVNGPVLKRVRQALGLRV